MFAVTAPKLFNFWRMRVGGLTADLALQFAVTGCVDRSEWRAG